MTAPIGVLGRIGARWPVPRFRASYESAATTRRTRGWTAPTVGPNDAILGSLATIRDRARQATRNDGYAKAPITRLVSNIIGTGISPRSLVEDPGLRERIQRLWLDWTDESDADGLLDFYGQQTLAVRCWLEAGECFVRLRPRLPEDGLTVPLQLQVIEPDLCPHTHTTTAPGGNTIRAGIEVSPIGRRVAYWFYRQRPELGTDLGNAELVRVPAESVVHLYDPWRAGQLRGVPQLTQALVRLHDLDKFDDATLLRQQIANLFAGFLKRGAVPEGETVDPLTGQTIQRDEVGPLVGLEPGLMQELGPGESLEWSDPPDAGQTYPDFMRQQLLAVGAAADVPYELLTGDMSRINDRTVRVILAEFRRRIQQWQEQTVVYQLCRPVWRAWMTRAALAGALDLPGTFFENPTPWLRAKWIPQGWAYIHPVQDVQAQREAVRSGFKTRAEVVSEQGYDVEEIDREIAADHARADALGLVLDSDPRKTDASGKAVAGTNGTPEPPEDPETTARVVATAALETVRAFAPRGLTSAPRAVEKRVEYDARGRVIGVREIHDVSEA